jgi:PIN domain nuclease of toxin-antitoxin system
MAAYLLDTCVVIWFFEGSERIPDSLRATLLDPRHDLYLSDVSILEVVIKYRLGKLPLPKPPSEIMLPLARKHLMDPLPLTAPAMFRLETLPDLHRDPFDRLLVCQALEHRLELVTPDPLVRQYEVSSIWER